MSHIKPNRQYSKAEYVSDAVVHGLGIGGALVAGPVLITLVVVWTKDVGLTTAVSIYAACLLAMWVCSALYNLVQRADLTPRLRQLDQSAIYFKIAGTYTPFVALASGSAGFLAGIWATALGGASIILFSRKAPLWLAIVLYLGLGWAGAVLGGPLLSGISETALALLVIGGLLYSAGIIFLISHRLPFHNTIWHVFVLIATVSCYAAIVTEVAQAA
ncbi:hemolysin III family protein [Gymnodinialimonas sp. 2305UL16-5]|uniref:PAQR family membrane homeostasis protein TrhA n=1 Tax=Gymnodinialimonas mytili TaxID=3126503 RepID=UPI003099AAE7